MSIYEIKRLTKESAPYFFSKETLRFFGQTLKDFKVYKQKDGRFKIIAPVGFNWSFIPLGFSRNDFKTVRFFNPINNKLERN
jgi:hypothetical protein